MLVFFCLFVFFVCALRAIPPTAPTLVTFVPSMFFIFFRGSLYHFFILVSRSRFSGLSDVAIDSMRYSSATRTGRVGSGRSEPLGSTRPDPTRPVRFLEKVMTRPVVIQAKPFLFLSFSLYCCCLLLLLVVVVGFFFFFFSGFVFVFSFVAPF